MLILAQKHYNQNYRALVSVLTGVNSFDTYEDEEEQDDRKQRYLITNPEVFMRHHRLFKKNCIQKLSLLT
jgi:hypothetical protein